MQIEGINVTLPKSASLELGKFLDALRVGQLIKATVAASTKQGQITLNIGGHQVQAQCDTPLSIGDILNLKVVSNKEPVVLKVQTQSSDNNVFLTALRAALPRQTSLTAVLANLIVLAQKDQQIQELLPTTVLQVIREIYKNLPDTAALQKLDGLKQALQNSGLFLETKLIKFKEEKSAKPLGFWKQAISQPDFTPEDLRRIINADFKGGLLRVLALIKEQVKTPDKGASSQPPEKSYSPPLRQTPVQPQRMDKASITERMTSQQLLTLLARQLESGLARIQLNQLASLPQDDTTRPAWSYELPVLHDETLNLFHIRIEQDTASKQEKKSVLWTVQLAFDLETLGPVRVLLAWQNQRISASIWAEWDKTTQLFQQHIHLLYDNLAKAGLTVGKLNCQTGIPSALTAQSSESNNLVNETV